jgi:hypothetical protein
MGKLFEPIDIHVPWSDVLFIIESGETATAGEFLNELTAWMISPLISGTICAKTELATWFSCSLSIGIFTDVPRLTVCPF